MPRAIRWMNGKISRVEEALIDSDIGIKAIEETNGQWLIRLQSDDDQLDARVLPQMYWVVTRLSHQPPLTLPLVGCKPFPHLP